VASPSLAFLRSMKQFQGKNLSLAVLLFASTLAWFYIFHAYLLDFILNTQGPNVWTVELNSATFFSTGKLLFYGSAVVSGIGGALIAERTQRKTFLFIWLLFGLLVTISPVFFSGALFSLLLSLMLGISFGLGFPACQALLAEATGVEFRGKIAGLSIVVTLIIVVIALVLTTTINMQENQLLLICVALKALGFLVLFAAPIGRETGETKPWLAIIKSKDFFSYAIPWLIFNVANGLLAFGNYSGEVQTLATAGTAIEFFVSIFAALAAGFLADRYGRKQPMIVGLVALGIGYALFGVASSPATYIIYLTVEGIAWGLIVVTYLQVVLGDISSKWGSKERFFALGGLTIPLLTRSLFVVAQELTGFSVAADSLSSLLSIVTFLSVIPLIRAPETLPEEVLRKRKMKTHIDKVGELVVESKKKK
jgi:MFS family permease